MMEPLQPESKPLSPFSSSPGTVSTREAQNKSPFEAVVPFSQDVLHSAGLSGQNPSMRERKEIRLSRMILEEFVKLAQDRGLKVRLVTSQGRHWLAQGGRLYALPDISANKPLPDSLLKSLCRVYGLSPLDCGLDEEPED